MPSCPKWLEGTNVCFTLLHRNNLLSCKSPQRSFFVVSFGGIRTSFSWFWGVRTFLEEGDCPSEAPLHSERVWMQENGSTELVRRGAGTGTFTVSNFVTGKSRVLHRFLFW